MGAVDEVLDTADRGAIGFFDGRKRLGLRCPGEVVDDLPAPPFVGVDDSVGVPPVDAGDSDDVRLLFDEFGAGLGRILAPVLRGCFCSAFTWCIHCFLRSKLGGYYIMRIVPPG